MRALLQATLSIAAGLLLAACTVDVEGAACAAPGTTEGCPSGQACGTGLTCSERALSCQGGAPCVAGTARCSEALDAVLTCTAEGDPACGTWAATACQAGVTRCVDPDGAGAAAPVCDACVECTDGEVACRPGTIDVMECQVSGTPACGKWVARTACTPGETACAAPPAGSPDPAPICRPLEGTACTQPGTPDACPTDQACGNDLKCSYAAATCSFCAAGAQRCDGAGVSTCVTTVDPVCGTWDTTGCSGTGETCVDPDGAGAQAPVCTVCEACTAGARECRGGGVQECQPYGEPTCGRWVTVDTCTPNVEVCGIPVAGVAAECRCQQFVVDPGGTAACPGTGGFPTIKAAFTEAQRWPPGTVLLGGAAGQTYGTEAADAAPIVIPAGWSLAGTDATLTPANRVIEVHDGSGEGIRLEAGARLAGVTVRRGASAPAVGVRVTGASPASAPSLEQVVVDDAGAGGAFATGVRVEGTGAVALDAVTVLGATGNGLEIDRASATDSVAASDVVLTNNDIGARVLIGDATLDRPRIKGSFRTGIDASPASGTNTNRKLTVRNGIVAHGGGTGLVLMYPGGLHLQNNVICANAGADRTLGGQTRKVGGVYLQGNPASELALLGNRVQDNAGDQVFVGAASVPWNISGTSCTPGAFNVFMGLTPPGVGLAVVGADVVAKYTAWSTNAGLLPQDYFVFAGTLDAGTSSEFCFPPTGVLDCPP